MKALNVKVREQAPAAVLRPLAVQVVRQYAPGRGGLEDVVANLSRVLLSRGFRVRVVTCDSLFAEPQRVLPPFEVIGGVEVVRIPWSGSSRYPLAPQVFRHIGDADLVHVHGIDFFFDALALGRFIHGKPMVVTTHGGFFHTPKYAAIKKIWFQTLTRLSACAYRKVLCCSQSDLAMFENIAGDRAVLVENGVDTDKFANQASTVAERRIVTIGRFSLNKRLDRLLDTMAVLVATDARWHLDIIGAPADFSAADLEGEIARRDLTANVSLHVSIENSQMRQILNRASLFAAASEYEGFGLAAVEAMSAGLVPILHPNDAYRVLAGRHPGVLLADFSDAKDSARQIILAFEALEGDVTGQRQAMIDAAETYSWDRMGLCYGAIYQSILGLGETVPAAAAS